MQLSRTPLITESQIAERVHVLGDMITRDWQGHELVVCAVLNGAVFFAADLARCIRLPIALQFIRARSYQGTRSSGSVSFPLWLDDELSGKQVLVVEDIVDTGYLS